MLSTALACGCAAQPADPAAGLFDTYWRAVQVDGRAVTHRAGTREPHLVLNRDGSRVSGFAGCNGFAGNFQQHGATLRLGDKLAMTRMACVGEGDTLETAFTKALTSVSTYRISGDRLELRDAQGTVRMIFEARGTAPAR